MSRNKRPQRVHSVLLPVSGSALGLLFALARVSAIEKGYALLVAAVGVALVLRSRRMPVG